MADVPEKTEEERVYNISISSNRGGLSDRKASNAIKIIKRHVARHMKSSPEQIWIDPHVNEEIWKMGGKNTQMKVKVKAIKFDDGLIEVSLPKE